MATTPLSNIRQPLRYLKGLLGLALTNRLRTALSLPTPLAWLKSQIPAHLRRDLKNALSRVSYTPEKLNAEQQRVLAEIKHKGIVLIPVENMLSSEEWESYQQAAKFFLESPPTLQARQHYYELGVTEEAKPGDPDRKKTYLIFGSQTIADSAALALLKSLKNNAFLRPVINHYYFQQTKLVYADYWLTLTTFNEKQDVYSQSWHCDPEGDKVLKVFIYFTDVNEQNGALQYITGTHSIGKYAGKLRAKRKRFVSFYPGIEFVETNFEQSDIACAKGSKGTVVICDTRGLHRGGKCLNNERVMAVFEFLDSGSSAVEI
jgi:hypothetical protein